MNPTRLDRDPATAMFHYDESQPLRYRESLLRHADLARIMNASYDSPRGGRVPALV